jgi:hypothetical protein
VFAVGRIQQCFCSSSTGILTDKEYSVNESTEVKLPFFLLQNICQECSEQMAGKYIENLLGILREMDRYNVCNDAVVGLLKGT